MSSRLKSLAVRLAALASASPHYYTLQESFVARSCTAFPRLVTFWKAEHCSCGLLPQILPARANINQT